MDLTEKVAMAFGVTVAASLLGVLALAIHDEVSHPCVRYERRHSNFTIIAWDHKMRPIYGPGDVEECVERAP